MLSGLLALVTTHTWSAANESPHNHTVVISYYNTADFSVTPERFDYYDGDTVTFYTDDPGTLLLRLDDGSIYSSAQGQIRLSSRQLDRTAQVRCSILLPDGSLLGWELSHEDRFGVQGGPVERPAPRRSNLQPPANFQATDGNSKAQASPHNLRNAPKVGQAGALHRLPSVTLSWDSVSYASGYAIFRAEASGGPYTRLNTTHGGTVYVDDRDLVNGKTYYYEVVAYNQEGAGPPSSEKSATAAAQSGIKGEPGAKK